MGERVRHFLEANGVDVTIVEEIEYACNPAHVSARPNISCAAMPAILPGSLDDTRTFQRETDEMRHSMRIRS
jgi:hypothetical protein